MTNIYMVTGENVNDIKAKINSIFTESDLDEMNITRYDLSETSIDVIVEDLNTYPFFSDRKGIVISDINECDKNKDIDMLYDYLKKPNASSILVFDGTGFVFENKPFSKNIKLHAQIINVVDDSPMDVYIKKRLAERHLLITDDALELLLSCVEKKVFADNEIEKLALYVEEDMIKVDDVAKLVSKSLEDSVFDLTNAIIEQNAAKSFKLYKSLIADSDEIYIMNTISRKMNEILTTKMLINQKLDKEQIAKELGVSSGRAFYMMKAARQVPMVQVSKYLHQLVELDYMIKSGQIDKKIGVELFLLGVK